jgi:hypothetical protein
MLVASWLNRYWQPLAAALLGIGISYYTWNEPLKVGGWARSTWKRGGGGGRVGRVRGWLCVECKGGRGIPAVL